MLQNVKKALANPEPSTHDPERTSVRRFPQWANSRRRSGFDSSRGQ
jgi:hypothetical protein